MKRAKHSLSHYRLITNTMGKLMPVGCLEVLPGDTFQHSTSALVRFSPILAPLMHRVVIRIHHFFVPNRIVWDGWEDFITGQSSVPPPTQPTDNSQNVLRALGYGGDPFIPVNELPLRAYNLIFNEFYRDQDLVAERNLDDQTIANIAWQKDYFTASRPWQEKGPGVTLPIGGQAPVQGPATQTDLQQQDQDSGNWVDVNAHVEAGTQDVRSSKLASGVDPTDQDEALRNMLNPAAAGWSADLSQAQLGSIPEIRTAFALQRYWEARARYGSRYTEYLRYLGVNHSDGRLQRPEYLGGGKQVANFSEVLQTTPGGAGSTVGSMFGHGISTQATRKYRRFFQEHGYVISLMSVRPQAIYETVTPRHFFKTDLEDYFQKELQFVGQQEVYDAEVYATSGNAAPGKLKDNVWGYNDRYNEYREQPSQVSRDFLDLLNYWHLARDFSNPPVLNGDFVTCDPSDRIFVDQTNTDSLFCCVNHSVQARRMVARNPYPRVL